MADESWTEFRAGVPGEQEGGEFQLTLEQQELSRRVEELNDLREKAFAGSRVTAENAQEACRTLTFELDNSNNGGESIYGAQAMAQWKKNRNDELHELRGAGDSLQDSCENGDDSPWDKFLSRVNSGEFTGLEDPKILVAVRELLPLERGKRIGLSDALQTVMDQEQKVTGNAEDSMRRIKHVVVERLIIVDETLEGHYLDLVLSNENLHKVRKNGREATKQVNAYGERLAHFEQSLGVQDEPIAQQSVREPVPVGPAEGTDNPLTYEREDIINYARENPKIFFKYIMDANIGEVTEELLAIASEFLPPGSDLREKLRERLELLRKRNGYTQRN